MGTFNPFPSSLLSFSSLPSLLLPSLPLSSPPLHPQRLTDISLVLLLPLPPGCWDCRCMSPRLPLGVLIRKAKTFPELSYQFAQLCLIVQYGIMAPGRCRDIGLANDTLFQLHSREPERERRLKMDVVLAKQQV